MGHEIREKSLHAELGVPDTDSVLATASSHLGTFPQFQNPHSENATTEVVDSLPAVNESSGLAAAILVPTLLKTAPSVVTSFLAHVVVLTTLALAFQQMNRGTSIMLNGMTEVAPALTETVDLNVSFDLPPLESALEDVQVDKNRDLLPEDSVALSGPASNALMLDEGTVASLPYGLDSLAGMEPGAERTAANQAAATQGDARFFGLYAKGTRFVYIIDCSGSMKGLRWGMAKKELVESIRQLPENMEFMVLLYNHDAWAMFNRRLDEVDLVPANEENKRRFLYWLAKQEPHGWTRPKVALAVALDRQPDAVFLLSDGELQDDSYQYLLQANVTAERKDGSSRKIPVHTIALDLSFGARLLEQIAEQNSGIFTHITSQNAARR